MQLERGIDNRENVVLVIFRAQEVWKVWAAFPLIKSE